MITLIVIERVMKTIYFILFVAFLPTLAWSQSESDMLEAAKLGLIEKFYASGIEHYRTMLDDRGFSIEEKEAILFDAIDAYAACWVLVAQAQAREQGLSEDIILKGIGGRTRGKEESLILLALDTEALKIRRRPCTQVLYEILNNE